MSMQTELETIEYSVCEDCLFCIAYGASEGASDDHEQEFEAGVEREMGGRDGSFSTGVAPTDEDPDGTGYEEFSNCECEICRTALAGSRHGVTLIFR